MFDEHSPFFERILIEQHFEPFAGGELALGMLCVDPARSAAGAGGVAVALKPVYNLKQSDLPGQDMSWMRQVRLSLLEIPRNPALFQEIRGVRERPLCELADLAKSVKLRAMPRFSVQHAE
jgi:hypothetical protein